ncbi:MAG: hypothetical protein SR1Q5_03935 [Quinella sp. 1Q5]|nr:hypothetical protein [Quinella sp. 1Q5]
MNYTVDKDGYLSATKSIEINEVEIPDDNCTWIWAGESLNGTEEAAASKLFPGEKLIQVIPVTASDTILTLSTDVLSAMDYDTYSNKAVFVDSKSLTYPTRYATITKIDDKTYELTKNTDIRAIKKESIEIKDNLTVIMDAGFVNVPIIVSGVEFASLDKSNAFTVPSSESILSIGGSNSLSLKSGILKATTNQSITAESDSDTYTIFDYNAAPNKRNGITLEKSSTGNVIIGGIDNGESLKVDDSLTTYFRSDKNLFQKTGSGNTAVYKLYQPTLNVDDDKAFSVDLASLTSDNDSIWTAIIAPTNDILEIGGLHNYSALVYNSVSQPTIKYASLNASGNDYTLSTASGVDATVFTGAINTISLSGGKTLLYNSLALGKTIATSDTKFIVTKASGNSFEVSSGIASSPSITGSTIELTLIKGSITATKDQIITLGNEGNTKFKVTSPYNGIDINFTGSKATLTGAVVGDSFTIQIGDNEPIPYSVIENSGEPITFEISNAGEVTINGLDNNNDVFGYNDYNHSIRSAGFVRDSSGSASLWNGSANHSLNNTFVTSRDLDTKNNWASLVTLSAADNSITITPANFTFPSILIDSNFTSRFGSISGDSVSYALSKEDNDPKLSKIHIANNNVDNTLSLGSGFSSVTITSANSSLNVTDTSAGYQVILYGNNTSLEGARAVSLIRGSLTTSQDSLTVSVGNNSIVASNGKEVIVVASGSSTSISGVDKDDSFSVNGTPYWLSEIGLVSNNKLLTGTKPTDSGRTFRLSDLDTNDPTWRDMIAPTDKGVLSISNTAVSAFVVNNTDNPESLFAELTSETNGYALTRSADHDAWDTENYTINIEDTKITLSGGFNNAKIKGTKSKAEFTTASERFIVQDLVEGAIITEASDITQTAGLIASSAGQTITNGNNNSSIIANNKGDGFKVSVASNASTIDGLNKDDVFTVNNKDKYSLTALGLVTGDKLWRASATETVSSVKLADLTFPSNWIGIASINNSDELVIPPTTTDDNIKDWIVVDSQDVKYGLLSSIEGGGYSLSTTGYTTWNDAYMINVDSTTVTLSSDLKGKNITGEKSRAAFTVDSLIGNVFTVTDATGTARITGAKIINQTEGTIGTSNQLIVTGTSPNTHSIAGAAGKTINTYVNDNNVTVGALDPEDSFTVDNDKNYTLLSNGRFQRSDNLVWNGKAINDSIALNSLLSNTTWNALIETDSDGNLTLDSSAVTVFDNDIPSSAAYVVKEGDLTTFYGTLKKNGNDDYTLRRTDASDNASLNSVTVNLEKVNFTNEWINIPITAGGTEFKETAGKSFTVNYKDGAVSVGNTTDVSLLSGKLIISDSDSNQTVRAANNKTFQAVSGKFTVSYDKDDKAVVAGIDDATNFESVKVNGKTYTLLDGDGFEVETTGNGSSSATIIKGLTPNDKFTIKDENGDSYTFTYTEAGLAKSQQNKNNIYFLFETLTPPNNQLTLEALWGTDKWLGLEEAPDGNITINNTLTKGSLILVDSSTDPKVNYGRVTYNEGTKAYDLSKYSGTISSIDEKDPTTITVENAKAKISADFSKVPLTSQGSTEINLTTLSGDSYTISGTINLVDIENKNFTPNEDDTFTVDNIAYKMTAAGLTKTESKQIWTEENDITYTLPNNDSWSNIVKLTTKGALDLNEAEVKQGNNVVVTNNLKKRRATITYTKDLYELSYTETENLIEIVKLATDNPPIDIYFKTTVQTGSGTYTVNGKAYTTDDGITLDITETTATNSTLNTGTVTIVKGKSAVTATNNPNSISVTNDTATSITATAKDGEWISLGSLKHGDNFAIGDTKYKVFGNTLAKLNSSGKIDTLYSGTITNNTLEYNEIINGNYDEIISLNENSELDLRKRYNIAATAIVVGVDDEGNVDPTKRIAQIAYNDEQTGYVLRNVEGGNVKDLNVLLNETFKTFSTALETTVTTVGGESFTINDKPFKAQNVLTIATEFGNAFLTNGKVELEENATITTRRTKDSTTISETIKTISGSLTVEVSNNDTVTIGDLNLGESFEFGGKTYTQTAIGLTDGTTLNPTVTSSVTVDALTSGKAIWQTPGGALTLSDKTGTEWLVADVDAANPSGAVNYGTLTKGGDGYKFAQTTALTSIAVEGVKVELPSECSQVSITAKGAEFTVTASGVFTIDATKTALEIGNVSAITLNSGTIPATADVPITALGNVITQTGGDGLTVTVAGETVTVGALNPDDSFTVGATNYKMTAAGLLDTTNKKLLSEVTTSYTLGSEFTPIIQTDGTTLDLSNQPGNAHVYDSIATPTKKLAELEVVDGVLKLTKVADGIDKIKLARNATLNLDFVATVECGGTTTINGKTYAGTGDLEIDATADGATLQSGTITLNATNPSAQATNDKTALTTTNGTISATASGGKFTTISGLNIGESFEFGGKTYTQSNHGLITGSTISEELAGEILDLSKLSSVKWENFIGLSNRTLDLSNVTADSIVYDDDTLPTVKLASFTVNNKRITLNGGDTLATAIDSVTISADTVLTVDFATQINAPSGTVTVNSKRYNGSSELIIDSDGATSTLYRGTVILDTTNPTVTPTDDDAILQVERGTINTTVFDGLFVTVGDLDPTDSFTFDGKTYTQTAVGLMFEDGTISEKLAGTAIELSDLADVSWSNIIVPSNGTLDLTTVTTNALVLDDAINPSTKFANLTINSGKLTLKGTDNAAEGINTVNVATGAVLSVDFATQINAPSGSVTVNDKTFNGTTELTLDFDGNNVTLTSGTVSLAKGDDVTATSGNKITASDGDGLTVNVNGDTITINGLNVGDKFKVDDAIYEITTAGLHNTSGKLWTSKTDYSTGLTLDDLDNAENWSAVIEVKDGVLNINSTTISNGEQAIFVDDAANPTTVLATLTKADDVYALTKNDGFISDIEIDGVKIAIDRNFAGVPITTINANGRESVFTVEPTNKDAFTVDATGNAPAFTDIKTITISTGKIELAEGQKFTLAEGAQDVSILTGNGTFDIGDETFTIAGLADDTRIEFTINDDGNTAEVIGFDKDATVTIDGTTYTAPQDSATLHYTDADGWYFEGFVYDEYTVTVHADGTITVNPGAKFTDVLSSGKTLDSSIQFAADLSKTPVTVINNGNTTFDIIDASGNTLAKNFVKNDGTTFNADGVEIPSLADMAGTSFILQEGQHVQSEDATITAEIKDCEVGVGSKGESLSVDKSATIVVSENISLSLNAGDYTVNGVPFTANGIASAITTTDGFEIDLATSDVLTYDDMTLADGAATLENSNGVTLAGGTVATNTENKTFNVKNTATLDDKAINTNMLVKLTSNYDGLTVGSKTFFVDGDIDGYKVNIAFGQVIGLENIGGSDGVTVGGIGNATIKTDAPGSFTVNDKTFNVEGNVIYRVKNDKVISIADATGTISGDFSGGVYINGEKIQIAGEASRVVIDDSTVTKILTDDEGSFTINDKSYEIIGDKSVAFNMSSSIVSGIESLEGGTLIIANDETDFTLNDTTIDLIGNSSPVTLGIVDSKINSVSGIDGTINGLEDATIYGMTSGVVNDKPIDATTNSEFDVVVVDGTTSYITGLAGDAAVNSAPSMTLTTAENGTFTFGTDEFIINDTLDASVDFLTDENSKVIGIDRFAGSISGGSLDGLILNGNELKMDGENLVIEADGEKITNLTGLEDGNEVALDLDGIDLAVPKGEVTINGTSYKLDGDEDGITLSDGDVITGLDKDATLTIGGDGVYSINGEPVTVNAGDALTVNRDGVYKIDPNSPPITEKTNAEDILKRSGNPIHIDEDETAAQTVDLTETEGDSLVLIDRQTDAPDTVKTGDGNDTVVARHGAEVEVDLNDNGETLIIPTAGRVSLENYNGDNAAVQTYEYNNLASAIKSNTILFGDGVMTLDNAVVVFDPTAEAIGSVTANLLNASDERQAVGFTNTAGGEVDKSDATEDYIMKGNYAETTDDTQKSGGSTIKSGSGNDTMLAGAMDFVDAGTGKNQIYLTDKNLRGTDLEGATIVLNDNADDKTRNFITGFDRGSDKIFVTNFEDIVFDYGASRLIMSIGGGQMILNSVDPEDRAYELKFTDGTSDYNAMIAKNGNDIEVPDKTEANLFLGNLYSEGINFSEYTDAIEVNLDDHSGALNGSAAKFYGIDRVTAGAGNFSITGAADTPNTLIAGTGDGNIWSNSGNDLMKGNTSSDKQGSTSFHFLANDGNDTITNFDFMSSASEYYTSDVVRLSGTTDVTLNDRDVVIQINNSANDYLTLTEAKGKAFRVNDDLVAKVDKNVSFDGFTNCYVAGGSKATLTVDKGMGNVNLWLSDTSVSRHGTMFYGDFKEINALYANGFNTLAGNSSENLIIGGTGSNSIWGGAGSANDTLVGGAGHNEFFFCAGNGHDVISYAHSGDVVNMYEVTLDQVAKAQITRDGVFVELTDGSKLDIQSKNGVEYRLADGSAWTANHTNRTWNKK